MPLLICSSMLQSQEQKEDDVNLHNMLVDRVEDALEEGSGTSEDCDHFMSGSEWSEEDDEMNEEMEDDLTLEQAQEELRKDALV